MPRVLLWPHVWSRERLVER